MRPSQLAEYASVVERLAGHLDAMLGDLRAHAADVRAFLHHQPEQRPPGEDGAALHATTVSGVCSNGAANGRQDSTGDTAASASLAGVGDGHLPPIIGSAAYVISDAESYSV